MIKYVGIDLGQKGAICVQSFLTVGKPKIKIYPFWNRFGGTRLRTILDYELLDTLSEIVHNSGETFVTIERPIFVPGCRIQAATKMSENYGLLRGMLLGLDVSEIWTPTPQQWKVPVSARGSDKSKMLKIASRITKDPELSLLTADAVLISEACRLHYR